LRRPRRAARGRGGPDRGGERLEDINLLDLTPVREAEWKDVDGWVVLQRPPPGRGGLRGLGDRLSFAMAARRIRLDDLGSCSWKCFDGETTVGDACAVLRERFGDSIEPVEERLGRFVRYLHQDGFLSYREE
jgi:hypothetical protein